MDFGELTSADLSVEASRNATVPSLAAAFLNGLFDQPAEFETAALKLNKRDHSAGKHGICYWPKYQPIPYRSKKLVIIVSEFA